MKIDRKYVGAFAVGVLWGAVLMAVLGVVYLRHSMIKEYSVPGDFDTGVDGFVKSASRFKEWSVKPVSCAFPAMRDGGKMRIVELCNPGYASTLLDPADNRKVAAMLPCRVAFYETPGGCRASRLNVALLGLLLGGRNAEILFGKAAPEQEEMLLGCSAK